MISLLVSILCTLSRIVGMITSPDDAGELTSVGRLAGQLPVDLQLGRLIAYGIALDIGIEAGE